ncbi:hypothetical protein BJQ90_04236 [Arthrobacter sp. SO3]|nr:hypothetical protein [Arthrobacter sp. SO3]
MSSTRRHNLSLMTILTLRIKQGKTGLKSVLRDVASALA